MLTGVVAQHKADPDKHDVYVVTGRPLVTSIHEEACKPSRMGETRGSVVGDVIPMNEVVIHIFYLIVVFQLEVCWQFRSRFCAEFGRMILTSSLRRYYMQSDGGSKTGWVIAMWGLGQQSVSYIKGELL